MKLRDKWSEVPAGNARVRTMDLYRLSNKDLLDFWFKARQEATTGQSFSVRGWYHYLYTRDFKNKKMMDVGSGIGIDGITFAQNSVDVTFVDILESNIELLKRLCGLLNLKNVNFHYIDKFESLEVLPKNYDIIWCQGSMINLPFELAALETSELLKHLPVGSRWIELAYPKERWINEGQLPLDKWGEKTDGGAPWIEWYDIDKLLQRLRPAEFSVILSFNFHNNDFNWFDLVRVR